MIYIYHHLGIGDHIICNGMVRYFVDIFNNVELFCHDHYKENIEYMYRDESRIKIVPYKNEHEINIFLNSTSEKFYRIGFENLSKYENSNLTFDQAFYDLAGLDFDIRFSKFYLERDINQEKEILNFLNPQKQKYIYVHDDPERGFSIDETKHRKDLKIIKNNKNFKLFDMIGVIENAEEIHTMQSGLFDLCNSIHLNSKIFVHSYVRKYSNFMLSKGLNPIEIIM